MEPRPEPGSEFACPGPSRDRNAYPPALHCQQKTKFRHFIYARTDEVNFPVYLILPAALGLGVYSASKKNEYQKHKNNVSSE
jgi:hypothetical protein